MIFDQTSKHPYSLNSDVLFFLFLAEVVYRRIMMYRMSVMSFYSKVMKFVFVTFLGQQILRKVMVAQQPMATESSFNLDNTFFNLAWIWTCSHFNIGLLYIVHFLLTKLYETNKGNATYMHSERPSTIHFQ